jgi:TrmH family RNA methyltransferase
MPVSELTSRNNPLIKTLRLITSGSKRAPRHYAIAEGIRVLEEAQKSSCEIEALLYTGSFVSMARGKRLLDSLKSEGVRCYRTPDALLGTLSDVQSSQGALALVKVPVLSLQKCKLPDNPFIMCACGIQDPGNLGTLIRTAAAAGVTLVCSIRGTVSARNPKAVRSSAGAFFKIPIIEQLDHSEFRSFCKMRSIRLFRSDPRKGLLFAKADLKAPCAILFGNEGAGLADSLFADSVALRIPMTEGTESLNVAVAGSLILYEVFRQRLKE